MKLTMLHPLDTRKIKNWQKLRRLSSAKRGPAKSRRSTLRGKRKPRLKPHLRINLHQVVSWPPFPPDLANVVVLMVTFLRVKNLSSTWRKSSPRRATNKCLWFIQVNKTLYQHSVENVVFWQFYGDITLIFWQNCALSE